MTYVQSFVSPTFLSSKGTKLGNLNGWQERHIEAVYAPRGAESPIVGMIKAWASYADSYVARYESPIGKDYVLGEAWGEMGLSLLKLLNGECGRLDCGTLDAFIRNTLAAEDMKSE